MGKWECGRRNFKGRVLNGEVGMRNAEFKGQSPELGSGNAECGMRNFKGRVLNWEVGGGRRNFEVRRPAFVLVLGLVLVDRYCFKDEGRVRVRK